jgi:hypothetical protein
MSIPVTKLKVILTAELKRYTSRTPAAFISPPRKRWVGKRKETGSASADDTRLLVLFPDRSRQVYRGQQNENVGLQERDAQVQSEKQYRDTERHQRKEH